MRTLGFMLLFVLLLLAVYLSLHFALYLILVEFFAITNVLQQTYLLAALLFLAASFVLGMAISHWQSGLFARTFYFLAASWVGIMWQLVIFLGIALGLNKLTMLLGFGTWRNVLVLLGLVAALCAVFYGMWNSFHLRIVKIAPKLKNLPEYWRGKKIVQISDIHLGFVFRRGFLQKIIKKIKEVQPEIVVITGDLFDGSNVDLNMVNGLLNELNAPQGVYFITGNHETYLGLEKVFKVLTGTGIRILRDEMVVAEGLQIIGVEYPLPGESKDVIGVIKDIREFDPNRPSILLLHEPVQIEGVKKAGISLQLSGHTHKGQLFPLGLITKIMYKGYDYGFKVEDNFAIFTSSGVGGWGPPLKTEGMAEIVEITLI